MSTNSISSDLREVLNDLVTVVKSKVMDAGLAVSAPKPDQARIRTAVLVAVENDSKNAKQIIESIALASAGSYTPSVSEAQLCISSLLEDELIEATFEGDRKKYSITKAGMTALKAEVNKTDKASATASTKPGLPFDTQFYVNASKLAPVMLDIAQTATDSQRKAAALVLQETRHKLHSILADQQ